jgi:hypothetical protein
MPLQAEVPPRLVRLAGWALIGTWVAIVAAIFAKYGSCGSDVVCEDGPRAHDDGGEGVTRSRAEARAEARKCVLLCANCHAEVEAGYRSLPEAA